MKATEAERAESAPINTFTTKFGINQKVWLLFDSKIAYGFVRRVSLDVGAATDSPSPGRLQFYNVSYEVQVMTKARAPHGIITRAAEAAMHATRDELVDSLEA